MENKVWIITYSYTSSGENSVLGTFRNKEDAKCFIADYVLENEVDSQYLELFAVEVQ